MSQSFLSRFVDLDKYANTTNRHDIEKRIDTGLQEIEAAIQMLRHQETTLDQIVETRIEEALNNKLKSQSAPLPIEEYKRTHHDRLKEVHITLKEEFQKEIRLNLQELENAKQRLLILRDGF